MQKQEFGISQIYRHYNRKSKNFSINTDTIGVMIMGKEIKFNNIYRFDNNSFSCKPYNSRYSSQSLEFIDTQVTDLYQVNKSILGSKVFKPNRDDNSWSGCFCFLDEFNPDCLNNILIRRANDVLNVARIPSDTIIWVRNYSHFNEPYFIDFKFSYEYDGKKCWTSKIPALPKYRWVKMTVSLALERTKLWKNEHGSIPEWLTEFFLVEKQLELLGKPNLNEKIRCRINTISRKYFNIFKKDFCLLHKSYTLPRKK
jgi:hypothetical protein